MKAFARFLCVLSLTAFCVACGGGGSAPKFSGIYSSVTETSGGFTSQGSGSFGGFFSKSGSTTDPNLRGGVGLTYTLGDNDGVGWVSGALVFGDPVQVVQPAQGGGP